MVGLFGMTAASTGASERTLKRVGTPYEKVLPLSMQALFTAHILHASGCRQLGVMSLLNQPMG